MNHILASKRDRATAHSEASVCLSVTTPHRKPVGIVVGGWTWVSQQICFFISVGLRVGRAGGRQATGDGRAGGGPRGDEQVRQKMDRQNYISRLSDADRLHTLELSFTAFEVWRPDLSSYQILVPIGYRATALSDASVCLSVTLPPHRKPVGMFGGGLDVGWSTNMPFFFCLVCGSDGLAGGGPR